MRRCINCFVVRDRERFFYKTSRICHICHNNKAINLCSRDRLKCDWCHEKKALAEFLNLINHFTCVDCYMNYAKSMNFEFATCACGQIIKTCFLKRHVRSSYHSLFLRSIKNIVNVN